MTARDRATVERELATARAELLRLWPTERPGFRLDRAPSKEAREALQRVIRLQNELDSMERDPDGGWGWLTFWRRG